MLFFPAIASGRSGPPPTPVPPRGSPSPFPQELHTPGNAKTPPTVRAKAYLLADLDTGQILESAHADDRRPIASLTKIMTALLTLENGNLHEKVTVSREATRTSGTPGLSTLPLVLGERRTVTELLQALLIQSANDAAVALAEHGDGSARRFVDHMNTRARELGMRDTKFASPNGLNDAGYSTATDLLTLTRVVMQDATFRDLVTTRFATIPAAKPGMAPRHIQNRDILLWLYPGAIGVKTGFTSKAGYCIVSAATHQGRTLIAVVLGEHTPTFDDAASLLNHGFDGFKPVTVAKAGEELGVRTIGGQRVGLVTKTALSGLVPVSVKHSPEVRIRIDADAVPVAGAIVGEATASVGATTLGPVPLVAASTGQPAAEQPTSAAPPSATAGMPAVLNLSSVPQAQREQLGNAARAGLLSVLGEAA